MILAVVALIMIMGAFKLVDPEEAKKLVRAGANLIDVRTREEFASGRLGKSRNIPFSELARRMREIGQRDHPVVVCCADGMTNSRAAAKMLRGAGFTKVYDLGPVTRWK